MPFPNTQLTLIARLVADASDADWQRFLEDYWSPTVRFIHQRGSIPFDQAEDLSSELFALLFRSTLLERWQQSLSSKLRTLICGVALNLLSNRRRVDQGRKRILAEIWERGNLPEGLLTVNAADTSAMDEDVFYRAWVEELLSQALRATLRELHSEGRGDYFRALYGRVCEGLSAAEIAAALDISASNVENYLRVAKTRLARVLEGVVHSHVERYCEPPEVDAEFRQEWTKLGEYLETFGGLEGAIRKEAVAHDQLAIMQPPSQALRALRELIQQPRVDK